MKPSSFWFGCWILPLMMPYHSIKQRKAMRNRLCSISTAAKLQFKVLQTFFFLQALQPQSSIRKHFVVSIVRWSIHYNTKPSVMRNLNPHHDRFGRLHLINLCTKCINRNLSPLKMWVSRCWNWSEYHIINTINHPFLRPAVLAQHISFVHHPPTDSKFRPFPPRTVRAANISGPISLSNRRPPDYKVINNEMQCLNDTVSFRKRWDLKLRGMAMTKGRPCIIPRF